MLLQELCFVLPSEVDDELHHEGDESKLAEEPTLNNPVSGGTFLDFVAQSLRRLLEWEWVSCCHTEEPEKRFSDEFYDTEGVQILGKLGGENPRIFSYSELYVGSNGFCEKEVLGSGGFGRVYRAVLPSDGTVVAVKCLAEKGERFEKTFMAELVAVAHLRHRNLVRLRGWCIHGEELLLVYDYMPNRSLDRVLFTKQPPESADSKSPLSWERRRRIIHGLASALNYLHEQLETQIIHRDVKASNVMLDSHFNARLGDFGLARWLEHDDKYAAATPPSLKNPQFRLEEATRVGGTIGYLPPENFQSRNVATAKSDVFSFGIVVLEIISGRRAVDLTSPDDQIILLDWMRKLSDEGMLLEAVDSLLSHTDYKLLDMERCIKLGLMCTFHDPSSRPTVKWVLDTLSGNVYGKLPDLPSFHSYPLYISLSSPSSSGTNTTTASFPSSIFVSANSRTIYLTAESGSNSTGKSTKRSISQRSFPVVETPRNIAYEELVLATNNFSETKRVAELDFGTAYQGFLENGRQVLVKRLGMKTCPVLRMRFANEFHHLGRLCHRNLIQLRGWCTDQGEMLVVYDYHATGLLSRVLFHHKPGSNHSILNWDQRYNIVKSLASAIFYLHEEWDEQVIHRNITSSAIILDPEMNPKLGSFGLAEFLIRNENGHHIELEKRDSVRGIFGYISPEYMDSGEATTMADVYSFGVVLLEVISGSTAVDFRRKDVLIVDRINKFERQKRAYKDFVDWRLNAQYNEMELIRLMKLAIACTRSEAELRPSMRQIVSILDGHDQWFLKTSQKKESREEWRRRNSASLDLIRRIKSLGIQ